MTKACAGGKIVVGIDKYINITFIVLRGDRPAIVGHGDGVLRIGLREGGSAKKTFGNAWNIVAREFKVTKSSFCVHYRPSYLSMTSNLEPAAYAADE